MNVVLHFQSPYATLLCCRDLDGVQLEVLPEVPYYIGPVARIGYVLPGSPPLADAVVEQMKDHNLAILRNHGLVTVGATLDLAIQNAVFFELNCRMIVEGEGKTQGLSAEAIAELRSASQV